MHSCYVKIEKFGKCSMRETLQKYDIDPFWTKKEYFRQLTAIYIL